MSGLLFRPLRQIADKFNTLQMGMVAVDRIFQFLKTIQQLKKQEKINKTSFKGKIEFKNVQILYILKY